MASVRLNADELRVMLAGLDLDPVSAAAVLGVTPRAVRLWLSLDRDWETSEGR